MSEPLPHPGDVDVDPERVAALHRAGAIELVDVREGYEWEAGRVAGARHVALERLAAEAPTLAGERPVVFYCRVGGRSRLAADAFRRAGLVAHSMDGGLLAWERRGLPLEPEGGGVAPH